jgi:hypothetical protein
LDFAKLVERFVELTGEAHAVESEVGEGLDGGLGVCMMLRAVGLGEDTGFEKRNVAEAPGGIGKFLDEVRFRHGGRLIFVSELAAVLLICVQVFGWQDGCARGQAVPERVARGTLFAGVGAGPVECSEFARFIAARLIVE